MKRNTVDTITIQDTVPHLLEALWNHDDTPTWLQDVIFEGIEARRSGNTTYSAAFWSSQLEDCRPYTETEEDTRFETGVVVEFVRPGREVAA